MKRLLLLLLVTQAPSTAYSEDYHHILLQCSPSDANKIATVSIDKTQSIASIEFRSSGQVKDNFKSLPVHFTADEIMITMEYTDAMLAKSSVPEGMKMTAQMRISRKSLSSQMFVSLNGGAFSAAGGDSVCTLQETNNNGNRI